ncbi:MAG TPA: spermidine/putrescine ABC transporter substrate-binding protein [Planctomycetota bacterium]|nr:spermidine/putrescine ABC transporter substrate-binding protein [Planctomycetota bacterium]
MRLLIILLLCGGVGSAADVTVYMYSEYIDPAIPGEFTAATGIGVTLDVYEAQEEMLAKLQAGGLGQYDVVVASDVMIAQMIALQLLAPLDKRLIPNATHLWTRFADPVYDRGNAYTLPYLWGTIGIAYRRDAFAAPPTWAAVLDPAAAVGPFVLMDEARSMLGSTLVHLGRPANSRDPADLAAAAAALGAAKADARCLGFDNGVAGLRRVAAGEAVAAVTYNGDAVREQDVDPGIGFAVPAEGGIVTVDNLCIAAKAPDPAAAHAFIDFLYRPEVAARNAATMRYATPNQAALPLIDAKHRADPGIYPPDEQMGRLHVLEDLGADTRLYDETWARIKAE